MLKIEQYHHDGLGLNDLITIHADERDPNAGGASHTYTVTMGGGKEVAHVQYQHGPRDVDGSTPGITDAALLTIVRDRMLAFQAGPFADPHNEIALRCVEIAILAERTRAESRAKRGVLGKNVK